jgi:hypothetical protein
VNIVAPAADSALRKNAGSQQNNSKGIQKLSFFAAIGGIDCVVTKPEQLVID